MALLWTRSNRSMSFLCCGLQSSTQESRQGLTRAETSPYCHDFSDIMESGSATTSANSLRTPKHLVRSHRRMYAQVLQVVTTYRCAMYRHKHRAAAECISVRCFQLAVSTVLTLLLASPTIQAPRAWSYPSAKQPGELHCLLPRLSLA